MNFFQDKEARGKILPLLFISAILWVVYAGLLFASTHSTIFIFKFLSFCFLIGSIGASAVTIGNTLLTIGNENGGLNKLTLSFLMLCSLIIAFAMDYGHPEGFLNEPPSLFSQGRLLVTLGVCALAYKLIDSKTNLYKAFMMSWLVSFGLLIIDIGASEDPRKTLMEGGLGSAFLFQTGTLWIAIWWGSKK